MNPTELPPATAADPDPNPAHGLWADRGLSRQRRHPAVSLLVSLLIHALLLSLTFGSEGLGLPGLGLPWQARRVEVPEAPELRVLLTPATTPAESPLPQADPEPPLPPVDEVPPVAPVLSSWLATAVPAPEPQPTPAPATRLAAAPVPVPLRAAVPLDAAPPPALPQQELIALAPAERARWVVPATPALPASASALNTPHAASSPPAESPAPRDAVDAARERALALAELEDLRQQESHREAQRAAQREAQHKAEQKVEQLAAAARQEAARQEALRQDAARAEAARLERERQEAARQLAARQETERQEAARQAAARQQAEAARQEAARQDAVRAEALRQEIERQEAARQAAVRQQAEAARQDVARAEAVRQEAVRQDAARQEAAGQEAARQEAARQDAARIEAARLAEIQAAAERREARLRAIGQQLNEEADRRAAAAAAAARQPSALAPSSGSARRGRLFGRSDANAELVLYAEAWSRKIQLNLTFDMVRDAARQPHTDPLVTVAIRSDGSVESVSFVRSSGVAAIDEAIRRIVQSQANYPAFSPALAREYDVIEIRRSWHFDMAIRLY